MASSSVPIRGWTYDVFLSFRGEDTRNNFVDHLHKALVQNGIRVFKDDDTLCKGNLIHSDLLKAIEDSRLVVVVFSKNYADSCWCLDELVKIMECRDRKHQKVLPVFYHLDPSEVRGQKRDFATAFRQHEEKFRDKVNKWRKVLAAAANLSGWHISPVNGWPLLWKSARTAALVLLLMVVILLMGIRIEAFWGESLFVNKIVQEITEHIQPHGMENKLIGIESRINKLNSLLGTEATHEVRMVGIYGMGGIGKTTIARALFRRISYKFDCSSYVSNVRENGSSNRDICALQQKILRDMMHHEYNITDPEDGAEMIQTRFCNKKVLLVLDDVDDVKQLEFLAATHEWFGAGSRIIITTRNKHLLSDTNANFKPALLLKEQAVELFSRHAFRKNSPPQGYEDLSNRAIGYTGRLPLALKVLGSFFRERQACVWESALDRLAETPNKKINETLKISFDGLEDYEQQIFLHIACLFKGVNRERVTRVLDSFGFHAVVGISVLIEKSLITDSDERLVMHDLLQEMGLKIVRQNCPNSMLWKCEVIRGFIKKNTKLDAVEAIVVPVDYHWDDNVFGPDVFENMKNLRLLDTYGDFTSCEPTFLPDELRWLRWDGYPFSALPVASMHKLGGLELSYCSIKHLWKGYKFMPNLKLVHLVCLESLESFPDVSGAPNIERLILSECNSLVEVHKSLGTLRKLVYLNVSGCCSLVCLPSLIEMPVLETLDLSNCYELKKFPEVSSGNEKLSNIHLNGCYRFKAIPSSICELKNLKSLHLQDCDHLLILPEELGSMEKLEELQLGFVTQYLTDFLPLQPNSINFHALTNLCCLRKLDLSWRPIGEQDFPSNFHEFSSLEELDLSGNSKLVELPASISHLTRLKLLKLNGCQQLQNIQGLPPRIQVLKAGYCGALEKIEDLTEVHSWLYKIWLPGCERLLENEENERYLDKMSQQSFLKKCAAVDHVLSICIPRSKIPSWFEEQQHGYRISLNLPPKCHTDVMGFVVCGVWQGSSWHKTNTNIHLRFGLNRTSIPVDYSNASAVAENESMWIVYIPFNVFQQQMYDEFGGEDCSHFVEGSLMISISEPWDVDLNIVPLMASYKKIVRCGAHVIYKEDEESLQQINTCIPDYGNSNMVRRFDDSFTYVENA